MENDNNNNNSYYKAKSVSQTFYKINLKCTKDCEIRPESTRYSKENIGRNFKN